MTVTKWKSDEIPPAIKGRQHKNCKVCDTHVLFDLDDTVFVHGEYYTKEQILKNQEKAKEWDKATTVKGYEEFLQNQETVELLKKRKEFYVDDLHKCNEQGLHGKSLHYESIIEELNLLLGHEHNWKYFKHIKYCKPCGIYKTMSDKEQQKILGEEK